MEVDGSNASRHPGPSQGSKARPTDEMFSGKRIKKGTRGRPKSCPLGQGPVSRGSKGFCPGEEVSVRWSDGLFYIGQILKVDEANDRCQIRFEDTSVFYILFKDIHRGPSQGEINCCVCQGEASDPPNEIVLCDNCGMGYHQVCHNPPIHSSILQPNVPFLCKLCTFAVSIQHRSSVTPSLNFADNMKHSLPYKLNLLTWDAQHRTNVEQCYCYCGGPGDWYCKMLQCCRCRQWFHEACVQCLDQPLLYGDRFYMFVCTHCNFGQEYIRRLQFRWVDVAQLALFHLTMQHSHKYYDLDDIIIPWLEENVNNLKISYLLNGKHAKSPEVRVKLDSALHGHKTKFVSGREVKKKATLWALITRLPPHAPSVSVPQIGPITDEVINSISAKGRKVKCFVPSQCQSPVPVKGLLKVTLDKGNSIMFRSQMPRKVIPETNNNKVLNGYSSSQCYNGYTGMEMYSRSNGHTSHNSSNCDSSGDEEDKGSKASSLSSEPARHKISEPTIKTSLPPSPSASNESAPIVFDTLIPKPPNFDGMHHPFITEVEKEVEAGRLKHFEKRITYLKKEYASELAAIKVPDTSQNGSIVSHDKNLQGKSSPEKKRHKSSKRKHSIIEKESSPQTKDTVRRSKRSRVCVDQYQHILQSFPRNMAAPVVEGHAQRWKWLSVVDQVLYGEKFEIIARRTSLDGHVQYLLDWNKDD